MSKITITIESKDDSGFESSIDEVKKKVLAGFTSGFDGNDDESYSFETKFSKEEIEGRPHKF